VRVLEVYVKTNDQALDQQIQEHDKVEGFNIFDAIMFGMKCSVEQHKQKETGTKNDGHN
jgi:hypothetical protein